MAFPIILLNKYILQDEKNGNKNKTKVQISLMKNDQYTVQTFDRIKCSNFRFSSF